jgi:membrane protein implicated in regulation of membrane protease activity
MDGLISQWWVWAVAALALGIAEMLAPAFVLLGFAGGAGVIAIGLLIAGPGLFGGSVFWMMVVFATLSLVCWLALRRFFAQKKQVKVWDTDIND